MLSRISRTIEPPRLLILLGTAIGVPIAVAVRNPAVVAMCALSGLLIGYIVSQWAKDAQKRERAPGHEVKARLLQLKELHDQSLISAEEYERKRQEILSSF